MELAGTSVEVEMVASVSGPSVQIDLETLGSETVELVGTSVEMMMVVIVSVMSIVDVASTITRVPCTPLAHVVHSRCL